MKPHTTLSVLGKSGCGKTTLLKIMAGLEVADNGKFTFNEENMFALQPQQRQTVYLSQEPLLFPHLSVFENIAFGLKIRKIAPQIINEKTNELIEKLGLSEHKNKIPEMLSGGQKQRVSFGRALIINPKLMLLDEPFGSLDAQTRTEMQNLYKKVATEFKISALFVTHDLKEALIMGDEIGQMDKGYFKIYNNKNEFYTNAQSGVKEEIEFWKKLIE
jgi:putrescine transport system ATP-binding protein